MDTLNCMLDSKAFFMGAMTMGILMLVLMVYAGYMRAQSLYYSWKNNTPTKLGSDFYYVVREDEYNQLQRANLPTFGRKQGNEE